METIKQFTNPVKAIRAKCLDCCGGNPSNVRDCTAENGCALFEFRFGKNPYRAKREITDEQRVKMAESLARAREKRLLNNLTMEN